MANQARQAEAEQSDRKVFHLRSYFIHTVDGKRHFWICDSHLSLSPQTRSHACWTEPCWRQSTGRDQLYGLEDTGCTGVGRCGSASSLKCNETVDYIKLWPRPLMPNISAACDQVQTSEIWNDSCEPATPPFWWHTSCDCTHSASFSVFSSEEKIADCNSSGEKTNASF